MTLYYNISFLTKILAILNVFHKSPVLLMNYFTLLQMYIQCRKQ